MSVCRSFLTCGARWLKPSHALRVEGEVSFEINYTPHHNAVTKSGQANFSNATYAMAELCDNAIQVRRGAPFSFLHERMLCTSPVHG